MNVRGLVRVVAAVVCLAVGGGGASASAPAKIGRDLTGLGVAVMLPDGRAVWVAEVKNGAFSGGIRLEPGIHRVFATCYSPPENCPTFKMDKAAANDVPMTSAKPGGYTFTVTAAQDVVLSGRLSAVDEPPPIEGGVIVRPSWDRQPYPDQLFDMMEQARLDGLKPVVENGVSKLVLTFNCKVAQDRTLTACMTPWDYPPNVSQWGAIRAMRHAPVTSNGKLAVGMKVRVRFVMAD